MRIIPLAALLSAFAFAGCAAGGDRSNMMMKKRGAAGMSACPSDRTLVNGECVLNAPSPSAARP
ncbi:MAG: hypothetical protein ACHQ2Z_09770 [Elusimicrobiota bacterium]